MKKVWSGATLTVAVCLAGCAQQERMQALREPPRRTRRLRRLLRLRDAPHGISVNAPAGTRAQ